MISRIIKNEIKHSFREKMRELKRPEIELYYSVLTDFLNKVFGNGINSQEYWNVQLVSSLKTKYVFSNFSILSF